ncbi:MAG: hypothetical protein ABSE45_10115 [Candidatus Acidiferrales bacterium]
MDTDAQAEWFRALLTGILFAVGMLVLANINRERRTGFRNQIGLIWPWWDYALAIYGGIALVVTDGLYHRLGRETYVVLCVFVAAPAILLFFLARHIRRANGNYSR